MCFLAKSKVEFVNMLLVCLSEQDNLTCGMFQCFQKLFVSIQRGCSIVKIQNGDCGLRHGISIRSLVRG